VNGSEATTSAKAGPLDPSPPEMPGLISEVGDVLHLLCMPDKHKLAELHPGNVLKIKDRRCKIEVVFDLGSLRRKGGSQAQ